MNQISFIGRLTADPEYRAGEKHEAATFRLAIPRRNRRDGEDAGAVFIDVVAFDGLARTVGDHLAKGRQVAVAGASNRPNGPPRKATTAPSTR